MVDLSYLSQPQLKFLTLTHQYSKAGAGSELSLAAFSPDVCIMFARHFGLDTANYEVKEIDKTIIGIEKFLLVASVCLSFLIN